jgi:hypothetical protein
MLQLFTTHFAVPQASNFLSSSESKGFLTPHRSLQRQPVPSQGLTWPHLGPWKDIRDGNAVLKLPGWGISEINSTTLVKCLQETFPLEHVAAQERRNKTLVPASTTPSRLSTPTKSHLERSSDLSIQLQALELDDDSAAGPAQNNRAYYLRMQANANEELDRATRQLYELMEKRDVLENNVIKWSQLAHQSESDPQLDSAPPSGKLYSADFMSQTLSFSDESESRSVTVFGPHTTVFIVERDLDALSVNEVLFMLADMPANDWDLALEPFQWTGDERQVLKKAIRADIKIRRVQQFAFSKAGVDLFRTSKEKK